jgi:hypothetical protein
MGIKKTRNFMMISKVKIYLGTKGSQEKVIAKNPTF